MTKNSRFTIKWQPESVRELKDSELNSAYIASAIYNHLDGHTSCGAYVVKHPDIDTYGLFLFGYTVADEALVREFLTYVENLKKGVTINAETITNNEAIRKYD